MDFSVIFQLRTKKFWWMDVIFYFVISLLIATVFCWLIFLFKNNIQRKDMQDAENALNTVGTKNQQAHESEVVNYQKKIGDFSSLLNNHEFASNAFAFMQSQTMPNVWFKQFSLDQKNAGIQLSGESDGIDAFSGQVAVFEKSKYVKNIGTLNSSLGESARIEFNINLLLDKNIFNYLAVAPPSPTPSPTPTPSPSPLPTNAQQSPAGTPLVKSNEKLITSFHLLLSPEVIGVLDETNYIVTLNVPYGTDVKNLTSSMVISPGATVLPASGVSQDFTNPITYKVTAQDGSVQNYTVRVVAAAPPAVAKKSNQAGYGALVVILSVIVIIAVIAGIFFFLRKRSKKQ